MFSNNGFRTTQCMNRLRLIKSQQIKNCCNVKGRSHCTFHSIDFHSYAFECIRPETQARAKSFAFHCVPKFKHGLYPKSPPIPSNSALFEGTVILSGVRNHSGCSRVHSFNPTMHRKNKCTTDVHSTARESPQCTVRVARRMNSSASRQKMAPAAESSIHLF